METEMADEKVKSEALKFVKKKKLAVISTVSEKGAPEAATVLYFFDDDFNFFFVTRSDSRKAVNIAHNGNVAVVIGTELGPSTMQMSGIAEQISSPEKQNEFIEKLTKDAVLQALYYGPFLSLMGVNFALYKVKITWARWLTLDLKGMREVYYQII